MIFIEKYANFMKQIIRLTESELHRIIRNSVRKIIGEDVLGNDWHENETPYNNYEPFEDQIKRYKEEDEYRNQHDWGTQGEEQFDPTDYDDPDAYRDDVLQTNFDPSDGDLYLYGL